jgi:hypothetical protein
MTDFFEKPIHRVQQAGTIPVLKAGMNAALHMSEDLKNTGKCNLRQSSASPTSTSSRSTTASTRSASTASTSSTPTPAKSVATAPDGIACWFLDTDYNEESFFVRHAYFLGANDPYSVLTTTLKTEINEEPWPTLYSAISRPFPKPASGRIAVKVIKPPRRRSDESVSIQRQCRCLNKICLYDYGDTVTFYEEWGFSRNPFDTTALPASKLGRTLLVGRDSDLTKLVGRLRNAPRIPTLEGPNGVGKTSLSNVAAYLALQMYCEKGVGPLLIPCRRTFQLSPQSSLIEFEHDVLYEVAQTLIERRQEIESIRKQLPPDLKSVDRWLNSASITSWQGTVGTLWANLGGGKTSQINDGTGFEKSGFRKTVVKALADIFTFGEGVVCVIDNLELLESSENARKILEQLRDSTFHTPGLRWVLSGSGGIITGMASSPRLEGYLAKPIEVRGLVDTPAQSILESRIHAFRAIPEPYLPLDGEDFAALYELVAQNIRSTLGKAEDFCSHVAMEMPPEEWPRDTASKRAIFESWLHNECEMILRSVERVLSPRGWKVFDRAVGPELDGLFSPSEYEKFGLNSIAALRPYVKEMESAGLVAATKDENDRRKKSIEVVAKGWLVHSARSRKRRAESGTPPDS